MPNPTTRRDFLVNSASATLAVLAGRAGAGEIPAASASAATEPKRTPRPAPQPIPAANRIPFAVIGCRGRGNEVGRSFVASGKFDLLTLCDCDEASHTRALEKMKGHLPSPPPFERDFRRVLENKAIEAVVIATPDHWHGAMTLLALDAGKHVYVEKPLSYSIAEGRAMAAAAASHPRLAAAVGSQQRSGPHFAEARDFIKSGALGRIAFARGWISQQRGVLPIVPDTAHPASLDYEMWVGPAPFRPFNESRCHYNWRFIRDYGTGEMGNWGAHWLDIIRWYLDLDLPTAAMGAGGQDVTKDAKEWPDTQTVIFEYPALTVLWEQRIWTESKLNDNSSGAEFIGEKGRLVVTRSGWTFFPAEGPPQTHRGSDLMGPHVENFYAAVRRGERPAAPMAEGHKTAVLCHLANLSVRLGRRLTFDPAAEQITGDADALQAAEARREFRPPWNSIQGA